MTMWGQPRKVAVIDRLGTKIQTGQSRPPERLSKQVGRGLHPSIGGGFRQAWDRDDRAGQGPSPAAYLKVVASLLPNDVDLNDNNLDSLRDEQLLARLRLLTQQAAPLSGQGC